MLIHRVFFIFVVLGLFWAGYSLRNHPALPNYLWGSPKNAMRVSSLSQRVVRALAFLTAVNFASFVLGTFYLGGDALNGYRQGQRYFLGQHVNGYWHVYLNHRVPRVAP